MKTLLSVFVILTVLAVSCNPYVEPGTELSGEVPNVSFTMQMDPADSNRVVVTSTGDNGFQLIWDFGNGTTSTLISDTAYFPSAGTYDITLTVSGEGGAGQLTQAYVVENDDETSCSDEELIKLCGGCSDPDGLRWTWSTQAGAITVGSAPGANDFFVSPEGGLAAEQYDDFYDFIYEDFQFDYINNGQTIFPELGFIPAPFEPDPDMTWTLSPGTGVGGVTQIIISNPEMFMGTKDSGPVYDIVELTETTLTVRSEIDGGGGWFEFYFIIVP